MRRGSAPSMHQPCHARRQRQRLARAGAGDDQQGRRILRAAPRPWNTAWRCSSFKLANGSARAAASRVGNGAASMGWQRRVAPKSILDGHTDRAVSLRPPGATRLKCAAAVPSAGPAAHAHSRRPGMVLMFILLLLHAYVGWRLIPALAFAPWLQVLAGRRAGGVVVAHADGAAGTAHPHAAFVGPARLDRLAADGLVLVAVRADLAARWIAVRWPGWAAWCCPRGAGCRPCRALPLRRCLRWRCC